jgi:transcriptional regulator with XRE-family HTH domain
MTPEQFRTIRKELGLTQAQLAERLGLNVLSVKRYESGDRTISKTVELLLECIQHH